jgi:hypothetical protein
MLGKHKEKHASKAKVVQALGSATRSQLGWLMVGDIISSRRVVQVSEEQTLS